jgi:hypothetical protein
MHLTVHTPTLGTWAKPCRSALGVEARYSGFMEEADVDYWWNLSDIIV